MAAWGAIATRRGGLHALAPVLCLPCLYRRDPPSPRHPLPTACRVLRVEADKWEVELVTTSVALGDELGWEREYLGRDK